MLDWIFLIAAVVGGTLLVCQFALTLFGMGDDGSHVAGHGDLAGDGHFDGHIAGDSMHDAGAYDHHTSLSDASDGEFQHPDSSWLFGVLSIRTLVAAGAFFGVAGKAALSAGFSHPTSLLIATVVGVCAMYGMYGLMRFIAGLSSSGNERIRNAVGREARVYIRIPAARKGAGKVQLSMQNRIVEYQAVTEDDEPLKTGQTVRVVGVVGSDLVKVRRVPQTVEV
jgi:hypothetical protein